MTIKDIRNKKLTSTKKTIDEIKNLSSDQIFDCITSIKSAQSIDNIRDAVSRLKKNALNNKNHLTLNEQDQKNILEKLYQICEYRAIIISIVNSSPDTLKHFNKISDLETEIKNIIEAQKNKTKQVQPIIVTPKQESIVDRINNIKTFSEISNVMSRIISLSPVSENNLDENKNIKISRADLEKAKKLLIKLYNEMSKIEFKENEATNNIKSELVQIMLQIKDRYNQSQTRIALSNQQISNENWPKRQLFEDLKSKLSSNNVQIDVNKWEKIFELIITYSQDEDEKVPLGLLKKRAANLANALSSQLITSNTPNTLKSNGKGALLTLENNDKQALLNIISRLELIYNNILLMEEEQRAFSGNPFTPSDCFAKLSEATVGATQYSVSNLLTFRDKLEMNYRNANPTENKKFKTALEKRETEFLTDRKSHETVRNKAPENNNASHNLKTNNSSQNNSNASRQPSGNNNHEQTLHKNRPSNTPKSSHEINSNTSVKSTIPTIKNDPKINPFEIKGKANPPKITTSASGSNQANSFLSKLLNNAVSSLLPNRKNNKAESQQL